MHREKSSNNDRVAYVRYHFTVYSQRDGLAANSPRFSGHQSDLLLSSHGSSRAVGQGRLFSRQSSGFCFDVHHLRANSNSVCE